jgi:uncharacterized protein (UPF0276 family)
MSGIWLGVTGGKPNPDMLLASGEIGPSGEVDVDRLKAAEWMDNDQLAAVRAQRPVLLHLDDGVIWPRSRRWAAARAALARRADTPWLSVHLDLGWTFLAYRWPGPSPIPRALARRWAVRSVHRLQDACQTSVSGRTPVLVENIPHWSRSRPSYTADPAFIAGVVEESGCNLLLDLAHARVAAHYQREPVRDYLARLPLDRLVEIHVSGPRPGPYPDGRLIDAHQPMLEVDYDLLAWVLAHSRPQAVTLEYSKDRAQIVTQLIRLRALLDAL